VTTPDGFTHHTTPTSAERIHYVRGGSGPVLSVPIASARPVTLGTTAAGDDIGVVTDRPTGVPDGWDTGWTQTNGASIFHVSAGGGEPIVLVHGGFQTWRCWRRMMLSLSESHRVVAVDLRGIGRSSRPKGPYDQVTLSTDVAGVMEDLGHARYHVVGHDLGAAVATSLAARHPDRVGRMVFLEYLLCGFGFEEALAPRLDNHHLWFAALNMVPDVPEMLVAGHETEYLTYLARTALTADPGAIADEDLNDYIASYSSPNGWRPLCEMFRATWQNAETNRRFAAEERVVVPSLALGGQFSAGAECARSLANVADDVTAGIIEGAAHWLPEEKSDELVDHLRRFFGTRREGPLNLTRPAV
jgi:pimeloyl-ACP methyl ester carboxylesterase